MHKKNTASITLAVWMLTVSSLMYLLHASELKLFIATVLMGFFIILYIIHPIFSKPRYIRNVYRMAAVGIAVFSLVIFLRILELFGR